MGPYDPLQSAGWLEVQRQVFAEISQPTLLLAGNQPAITVTLEQQVYFRLFALAGDSGRFYPSVRTANH
jgi:hypothetical protein